MKFPVHRLTAALKDRVLRLAGLDIKAEYINSFPSAQNTLDIFKGEWASKLPPPHQDLIAGKASLFEDGRITWLGKRLSDVEQMHVLECGPLEGGHTYMLENLGVASILSVEANTRAFLRCLVLKELLALQRSRFVLGDFVSYLRNSKRYDLIVACGVLYHLVNPVEALALMSRATDRLYIWTHYFDHVKVNARPSLAGRFQSSEIYEHEGFRYTVYKQNYQSRLGNPGFMGGSEHYSHWLSREHLIGALNFFGFDGVEIQFDRPDDAAGPNISLMATRRT